MDMDIETPGADETYAAPVREADTATETIESQPTRPAPPQREARPERPAGGNGSEISMKALLEAGVHFGHQTKRWNPKMKPYIFTERNGIHIIDLQQTVTGLQAAMNYVTDLVANGGKILFVGTKKHAQEAIEQQSGR